MTGSELNSGDVKPLTFAVFGVDEETRFQSGDRPGRNELGRKYRAGFKSRGNFASRI